MSYQEDLILSIYGRGEPGLAMADPLPPPDKDPRQPRPDPSRPADSPYLPGKSPIPSKGLAGVPNFPGGGYGSTSGAFVDLSGEAYFLIDGELIPQGGYDPAKHGDLIPHGGPDIPQAMNNQGMMIAQGPELGGTGRLLTIGEYNQAVDRGFNNLMGSDMTPQDFEDYLEIKKTARRQMLDGV